MYDNGMRTAPRLILVLFVAFLASLTGSAEPAKVDGKWNVLLQLETITGHPVLTLKQNGEKLTGTYEGRYGPSPLEGEIKENRIAFAVTFTRRRQQDDWRLPGHRRWRVDGRQCRVRGRRKRHVVRGSRQGRAQVERPAGERVPPLGSRCCRLLPCQWTKHLRSREPLTVYCAPLHSCPPIPARRAYFLILPRVMKMLARRSHRSVSLGVLALLVWLAPAVTSAQVAPGVRAGVSLDPDQFYIGGHIET